MTNGIIANILRNIGIYLEIDSVPFKPRAYEKAAEIIEGMSGDLASIYKRGGLKALEDLPGIGISIAGHIEELLKTGKLKYYEGLKKKTPVNLDEFSGIEGIGPKTIKILYEKLGIRNFNNLKKAVLGGKIKKISGFGIKSEQNILKSIEFAEKSGGRAVLGYVMPEIREIKARLSSLDIVSKAIIAGSARRRKETIGDIDTLVVSKKPADAMRYFVSMPEVARVYAQGNTKSSVRLKNGLDVDLRVVPAESYGSALSYFTGSKEHNVALRKIAIDKGLKLNEYGLYRRMANNEWRMIAGKTEEEIYKALGLDYIEPELREMTGELEAAKNHKLPKLIGYGDLKGDLHVHSDWTDGTYSIEKMAEAAIKEGLGYIAITDHTKRLAMTHGLDEKMIKKQWVEIDRLNKKFGGKFKILKGTECDILKDGSMDLSDEILKKCDIVGASVHSLFNLFKKDQTERIKRAMSNPNVDIICHPTGRVLNKREGYQVDIDEIIMHAKKTSTVLEINSFPDRLDLKDEHVRKCVGVGVKMAISSDGHSTEHFKYLEYGIAQARRGWATKRDIINVWDLDKMLKVLK